MRQIRIITTAGLVMMLTINFAIAQDAEKGKVPEKAAKLIERLSQEADKSDKASDKIKAYVKEKLAEVCLNPIFVKEAKAQNAKKISMDEVKQIDLKWQEAEEELPIQAQLMSNSCAKEIQKLMKEWGVVTECFVMDNQGANVGQNTLTSDYWQGDEAKWKESYNSGKGGLHVDKTKLDKSTNQVDQKIALPLVDSDGNVVGAICIGLNVERVPVAK